jgi:hypothetical protein
MAGIPLRQTMEGMGYTVGWDPATKGVSLTSPYGQKNTLASDQYSMVGDRAYMDPTQVQSYLLNPEYYKPQPITQESVTQKYDMAKQLYSPMTDMFNQAYEMRLGALNKQSEGQQGLVEAAYGQGRMNLEGQEQKDARATTHQVAGRNISNSPLAAYEKRKTAESYVPQYQQLESNRGAQIANIANNAIAAAQNLAAQGLTQQAQYAAKIGEAAYGMLQQEMNGPKEWATNSLNALGGMATNLNTQAQQGLNENKFAYEQMQNEREWPYRQATYEKSLAPAASGSSGGGGSTAKPLTLLQQAQASANNDPRMWQGAGVPEEGRWSSNDLINAYIQMYGGGGAAQSVAPSGTGGISDEELLQFLR